MTVSHRDFPRGPLCDPADRGSVAFTERFGGVPAIGRGAAHFVGGTEFTVTGALLGSVLLFRLLWRMNRAPGLLYRRFWYRYPLTFGSLAYFDDLASIEAFTRTREHRAIQRFAKKPRHVRGGFVRIYSAEPFGITMGGWIDDADRRCGDAAPAGRSVFASGREHGVAPPPEPNQGDPSVSSQFVR
jgi:hypothetical protein